MNQAKLSLSPTPVTRAILPEKSMGIMTRLLKRDGPRTACPRAVLSIAVGFSNTDRTRAARYGFRSHTTTSPTGGSSCVNRVPRKHPATGHEELPVLRPRDRRDREVRRPASDVDSLPSLPASSTTRSGPLPEPSDTAIATVLSVGRNRQRVDAAVGIVAP